MESLGWNYGIAKRKLQAFKQRVMSHKNKIDRCLRYHAKVLECATVKCGNVVKELENVREENRRLDRDITALGLFYQSKMLQLKLRYQMEIIYVMAELELDITAWTITQRKAILKLQELMELRRRIEGYLIHVHFLLKAISDHEARLQRMEEPPRSD